MEVSYYNLSGGINLALTKTELGSDTKKLYWTDSENVEILQNRGIIKQSGNTVFLELPVNEAITGMFEMRSGPRLKLVITTISGKIYIYNYQSMTLTLLDKTITGAAPVFASFLDGVLISSKSDSLFYIKNNESNEVVECNLTDDSENPVYSDVICVYNGRVWVASGASIYYSALGTYDDFSTTGDAGYIRNFYTNTDTITALKTYKDYLAIYKKSEVYLLTGMSEDDFAIVPFANKGAYSSRSIVNVENKQYFLNTGIFALEQVGELNQIQLGSEISKNITEEFKSFNKVRMAEAISLHYENRNQVWYFLPYSDDDYFHTIWINDYVNKSWYKRVVPQNITCACMFNDYIISADSDGKIYREDYGSTFAGEPIKFMWKSPFLALGSIHHRKLIDEFYFILDESYDNNFDFTVYKDYDSEYPDDAEKIYSMHYDHLMWADDNTPDSLPCHWAKDDEDIPIWPINADTLEKAEISESNYSVQLCISGEASDESCAIIGLQFREIYNDD